MSIEQVCDEAYILAARKSGKLFVSARSRDVFTDVGIKDGDEFASISISDAQVLAAQAELDRPRVLTDKEAEILAKRYLCDNLILGNGKELVQWIIADYEAARQAPSRCLECGHTTPKDESGECMLCGCENGFHNFSV